MERAFAPDLSARSALEIRGTPSPELQVPAERLVKCLSFIHFAELIPIDDPLKRAFYEIECIQGSWSVRELKRQIGSLYYERSGLSRDKNRLATVAQAGAEQTEPQLAIRDPYVFEFLGIKSREVMSESNLEDSLLDRIQDFPLELGHGFCFELCTRKDHALVEYALSGMDSGLFVSKYLLELLRREKMQRFLEAGMRGVGDV